MAGRGALEGGMGRPPTYPYPHISSLQTSLHHISVLFCPATWLSVLETMPPPLVCEVWLWLLLPMPQEQRDRNTNGVPGGHSCVGVPKAIPRFTRGFPRTQQRLRTETGYKTMSMKGRGRREQVRDHV